MNIAIGQYYPENSVVHNLDPRMKLIAVTAYIVSLFSVTSVWGYLFTASFLILIIIMSKVPILYVLKGLKAIAFIIIFTSILNIFFTQGDTVLFSVWRITVTAEGLAAAGRIAARLILLIAGSSLLTLTTSPIKLSDALEFFMRPLKVIRVPAHEIAMMMTIALRFIPTLVEEMQKIMKAQMARGADFASGGLVKKAKSIVPLLVPLFVSAFRRADELALAMESRCYRGDINRTKMKKMKFMTRDFIAAGVIVLFIGVGMIVNNFL
ncbi:MAG: energy-coupling factor transporter transmembrane protein EcfT [Defluviitaleaceae bacterium]|nr:energy-coupling factor transporter transmembrane protein EcfT [Defluviitaleaceae bacterium]